MRHAYEELLDYIQELTIIDTHEHLPPHEKDRDPNADILSEYLTHYFNRDLVSSGLSKENLAKVMDTSGDLMERWRIVEPYWERCRYTGYGRSLDLTAQALYGAERIDGASIQALNQAFRGTLVPGHYRKILKEKCRIETSILDAGTMDADLDIYTPILHIDTLISLDGMHAVRAVARDAGMPVTGFDSWLRAAEALVEKWLASGQRVFKSALAYERSLLYDRALRQDAEAAFNTLFDHIHYPDWAGVAAPAPKAFGDYMIHYVLQLLSGRDVTIQFHTGLQEGNGNLLYNSDPGLLSNLFLAYPQVDFDIFHMGYPFQNVAGALAKNFPNVFLDMCWGHIISPQACVSALSEWLDAVPYSKISAFGGDYCMIDPVYGHQLLARKNVARTLALKVDGGELPLPVAKTIAKALFYDNPKEIFRLG